MGCGISSSANDQINKNKKAARVVQQLFAELQDEENDGALNRGDVLVSIKYKSENELVLIHLLKGCNLLSRDGLIHSCNPYMKIELKYNADVSEDCGSPKSARAPLTVPPSAEHAGSTLPRSSNHKFTRSISLLQNYEQFKQKELKKTNHYDIDKLDLAAQTRHHDHKHEQQVKGNDSSPSHPISFKHEISTTVQSKVVWHTRNPEFDELFLFNVTKKKLASAFLFISVMDKEILAQDMCIGRATVPLGPLSITGVQSIPPQWFTIKKSNNKDSSSELNSEDDRTRRQREIKNQEFREAMKAHNSLQGLVMAKGTTDANKRKSYRLTSIKHQQHARIVM